MLLLMYVLFKYVLKKTYLILLVRFAWIEKGAFLNHLRIIIYNELNAMYALLVGSYESDQWSLGYLKLS